MIPKRSRKGALKSPARVVAPTSVKGGKLIRILCTVAESLPTTISRQ